MAEIDNLNFKVILDDKDFNDKVQKDISTAKELNTSLTQLLDVKAKIGKTSISKSGSKMATELSKETAAAANAAAAQERLRGATANANAAEDRALITKNKLIKQLRTMNASQGALNKSTGTYSRLLREAGSMAATYLSIKGVGQFVSELVRITGEFEKQETTLAAILRDGDYAKKLVSDLKGLAVESPFQFKDLTTYAKQLSAYSVPMEELYETTKMLADVSAGLGVGMDRLILAYGQVRSAAFLRGQEVRQFTEAGIPILAELAKQFEALEGRAISAGEVFDRISARLVPFEMVAKVFQDMTAEGGKFYEMQAIQAETLAGKVSNLKDAYEIMLNEIGSAHSDKLKAGVDSLRRLMDNWERIGNQLVDLIKLFGAYKVAVSLLKISDTIADLGGLSKALRQTAVAQKLLNSALLNNPYIAIATAVTALTIAISRAVKETRQFKKELEGIASTQYGEADKAAQRFGQLVDKLKSATEGSHNYREAISQLNNEYGDFLPRLLEEKNALDLIKSSSDAVTQSIYNRAKARAYENAQQKIEEVYGESRDYYAETFMQKLKDNKISEQAAKDLFANFNAAIAEESDEWNPAEVFNKVYKEYFNTTEDYFTGINNVLNDIKQSTPFLRNVYGKNTTGWQTARDALWNYSLVLNKVYEIERANQDLIDAKWQHTSKSQYEAKTLENVAKWYEKQKEALDAAVISEQERAKRLKNLDISRLQLLVQLYEKLEGDPTSRRSDLLKNYKDSLEAMTKDMEGWQGIVEKTLKPFGIFAKGKGDFGLFATETDSYLTYINNLRDTYKGLEQQIIDTAKANPELNAQLTQQKKIIEAIANALSISLVDNRPDSNPIINDLKRRADAIKDIMKIYEQWMDSGLFKDAKARELLGGIFGNIMGLDEQGRMKTNFQEQIDEIVASLRKYGKEGQAAAEQVEAAFGKASGAEKAGDIFEKRKEQIDNITKAIEKYYEKLSKWKGEDFNLGGVGVDFDIRKIAADLNTEMDEIDRRANELKRLFATINEADNQDVSEDVIGTVKDIIIKEHGQEIWDKFWELYKEGGLEAIKEVADAERESLKATAKNNLVELAQAKVTELTKGLDLTDWTDKSLGQINSIIAALESLLAGNFNLTDTVTEEKLKALGITLDDLKAAIMAVLSGKFNNATEEKFKKLQDKAKQTASIIGEMSDTLTSFGEALSSDFLVNFSKGLEVAEEFANILIECDALWDTMSDSVKNVSEGAGAVAEETANIADSSDWITMVIKVVLLAVEQIANAISAADAGQRALNESASKYRDILHEIALEQADTIWGENYSERMKANLKNAKEAYDLYNAELQRLLNQDKGGVGKGQFSVVGKTWNWDVIKDFQGLLDYYDLIDEMGNIDMDWIQGNLDALIEQTAYNGTKLKRYLEKDLEGLVELYQEYKDAYAQIKSSIREMLGQTADDFASNMIDSFLAIGDAADDLGKVFEDLGRTILQTMVKDMLIGQVLNKYTDQITDLFAKKATGEISLEDFVSGLGVIAGDMTTDIEGFSESVNIMAKAMQNVGLLAQSTNELDNSLGSGIKGITEDTANLLASYLNAIRADVSQGRMNWQNMDATLTQIAAVIPNIADYAAKIEAHTYNISQHTQSILLTLQSVISYDDGSAAIRTY